MKHRSEDGGKDELSSVCTTLEAVVEQICPDLAHERWVKVAINARDIAELAEVIATFAEIEAVKGVPVPAGRPALALVDDR